MKKQRKVRTAILHAGIILLAFLVLGVLVPIGINECYKMDTGYVTVWSGAELLGYYGTLLGTAMAVFVLAVTISFNRKQLLYERDLQRKRERWREIETMVDQAIDDMQPARMRLIFLDAAENSSPERFAGRLLAYEMTAKCSADRLRFSIDTKEEQILDALLSRLEGLQEKIGQIKEEHLNWLQEVQRSMELLRGKPRRLNRKTAERAAYGEVMETWKTVREHEERIYEEDYRALIVCKKETFQRIQDTITAQAEKFLFFELSV